MSERGPNDLEEMNDKLKKQVEFMQGKCREAGKAILDQELTIKGLKKEIDRLSEENDNFKTMLNKLFASITDVECMACGKITKQVTIFIHQ